jgi:hypothetical protein
LTTRSVRRQIADAQSNVAATANVRDQVVVTNGNVAVSADVVAQGLTTNSHVAAAALVLAKSEIAQGNVAVAGVISVQSLETNSRVEIAAAVAEVGAGTHRSVLTASVCTTHCAITEGSVVGTGRVSKQRAHTECGVCADAPTTATGSEAKNADVATTESRCALTVGSGESHGDASGLTHDARISTSLRGGRTEFDKAVTGSGTPEQASGTVGCKLRSGNAVGVGPDVLVEGGWVICFYDACGSAGKERDCTVGSDTNSGPCFDTLDLTGKHASLCAVPHQKLSAC